MSMDANSGSLPGDLSQLKPFFETPVDDATLARYSLSKQESWLMYRRMKIIVGEKAPPVDDQVRLLFEFECTAPTPAA